MQCLFCPIAPSQNDPPFDGGGLLHSLFLVVLPLPQVSVQADHELQKPHCPSTIAKRNLLPKIMNEIQFNLYF